jgi:hypothetical protein
MLLSMLYLIVIVPFVLEVEASDLKVVKTADISTSSTFLLLFIKSLSLAEVVLMCLRLP